MARKIHSATTRILFAIVLLAFLARPLVAQQAEEININVKGLQTVDPRGNAHVQWSMSFNPARGYDRVRKIYSNLYVLFRDLGPERAGFEINRDTLRINSDDGQRSITVNADFMGAAVCKNNRWQLQLEPDEQISNQEANRVYTVAQTGGQNGVKMTFINTYVLPVAAHDVRLAPETHLLTYSLPLVKSLAAGKPEVDVNVRYKKRLIIRSSTAGLQNSRTRPRCSSTSGINIAMPREDPTWRSGPSVWKCWALTNSSFLISAMKIARTTGATILTTHLCWQRSLQKWMTRSDSSRVMPATDRV